MQESIDVRTRKSDCRKFRASLAPLPLILAGYHGYQAHSLPAAVISFGDSGGERTSREYIYI